ncbi:MAG TPA: hypothetical protein VMK65_12110, partial [Longimicrobiales bacterium]|nr:hypothetical protein [Longimicrobiales bacterium]
PASDAAPESAASTPSPAERPEEAPAAAPVDPIPGLLGEPVPTPAAAQAGPFSTGQPGVVEAGGAPPAAEGDERERPSRTLLGRPTLLGLPNEGGPSQHASFLIPMQQRNGNDGGKHGIPWRIHVTRPAW